MKKQLLIFILLGGLALPLSAQHYLRSAGLRMGHTSGITFQQFVEKGQAFELMVSGRHQGLQFNTLFKWHSPARFSFNENFVVYYGGGAHVGFERLYPYNLEYEQPVPEYPYRRRAFFVMGLDALVGLEYRFLMVPISLSFEVKPYLNYIGFKHIDGRFWDSAISVRYVFND